MAAVEKAPEKDVTASGSAVAGGKLVGTANGIAQSWTIDLPRFATGVDAPKRDEPSPFTVPHTKYITDYTVNRAAAAGVLIEPRKELPSSFHVVSSEATRCVDGVISEIKRDTVLIRCFAGSRSVTISLPPSLIPKGLLIFGKPVRISLDERNGIRTPIVEARSIQSQPGLPGQSDVEAWLDKL
jgi:hypothetical protein